MFCPKCGAEAQENQRFCKACGTSLQMIYDALGSRDSTKGPFGIDVDSLTRNAMKFAESWKAGWSGMTSAGDPHRSTKPIKDKTKEQMRKEYLKHLPKPSEWMSYSSQHNLKSGLLSLFFGLGFGAALYYLGQHAINSGLIRSIEELPNVHVVGLEQIASFIWLFALIPVFKGIAQIIYAAFFAEPMATLAERFKPPLSLIQETGPLTSEETEGQAAPPQPAFGEVPPSVTEHTTQFFEEAKPQARRVRKDEG